MPDPCSSCRTARRLQGHLLVTRAASASMGYSYCIRSMQYRHRQNRDRTLMPQPKLQQPPDKASARPPARHSNSASIKSLYHIRRMHQHPETETAYQTPGIQAAANPISLSFDALSTAWCSSFSPLRAVYVGSSAWPFAFGVPVRWYNLLALRL